MGVLAAAAAASDFFTNAAPVHGIKTGGTQNHMHRGHMAKAGLHKGMHRVSWQGKTTKKISGGVAAEKSGDTD